MLDRLNRLMHGFVAVPVLRAMTRAGVFARLAEAPATLDDLARATGAAGGPLAAGLRLSGALRLIERRGPCFALIEAPVLPHPLDRRLAALATAGDPADPALAPVLDRAAHDVSRRWDAVGAIDAGLLDGTVAVPLLVALERTGRLPGLLASAPAPGAPPLPAAALAEALGWTEPGSGGRTATPFGRFLAERALIAGTTASYAPMLAELDAVFAGDAAALFGRDDAGHERHVDRGLNVVASGFQHQRYFADLEASVVALFDTEALADQPRFVVDTGCGDGTLLHRLWTAILTRTRRGRSLAAHPLVMVGADFNAAALAETAKTLADVPHRLVAVDIADPARLEADLAAIGCAPGEALHVRSFLDHDRAVVPPSDTAAARRLAALPTSAVAIGPDGTTVPSGDQLQALVEHLARWQPLAGRHGLTVLEVHSLPPEVVAADPDGSESLHFDAYHALSGQQLVEAPDFLFAAAAAGLFPDPRAARRYPATLPFTRIALNRLVARPWRLDLPGPDDLDDLVRLEASAWPAGLAADRTELTRRMADFPGLQAVLRQDGRIVAAVWSQRVASSDRLRAARADEIAVLADPAGPVIHLLGLTVHPDAQDRGLGDALMDFALLWHRARPGVEAIAGLSRCRDFDPARGEDFAAHALATGPDGLPLDPVLRFHAARGARVVAVVPGYRPADTANRGHGVLIRYEASGVDAAGPPASAEALGTDRLTVVIDAIRRVRAGRPVDLADPDRAFRDIGLDSLDLLELRRLLARRLGSAIDPTHFFSHPTPRRLAAALGAGEAPPPDEPPLRRPAAPQRIDTGASVPIAVVGIGCRFPGGVNGPEDLWDLVERRGDAIGPVPASRRASAPDAPAEGGFVDDAEAFDAAFFRIDAGEAARIDPQHRILLETARHALDHAAVAAPSLAGSRTGIFLGLFAHDWETRLLARGDAERGPRLATGNAAAMAAGRLAYLLGTEGPALTLDTACSSSLVAVHLACRSLRAGECDLALAGAANLILGPDLSVAFARAGMLAPDARCRAFDAAAAGYVRSEGVGVVVLERLDDALAAGRRILAVIRGSAVNQDGASNGLTAPNGRAQAAVIRAALADAGVAPAEVDLVEAHGTGTPLGDPVEIAALAEAYGVPGREPLRVGSVKTNIGHAEAAAGMAGLVKTVMALARRRLPAQRYGETPNPRLDLGRRGIEIATRAADWPSPPGRPRRAGLSAFGFSGTNAHLVLEEAPQTRPAPPPSAGLGVLPLSAADPDALREAVAAHAARLRALPDAAVEDMLLTAGAGREHLPWRIAVTGDGPAALAAALDRTPLPEHPCPPPRIGFLFTGQGAQVSGMTRALHAREPIFRATFDRLVAALADDPARDLADVVFDPARAAELDRTEWTQPALVAVEIALAALWAERGIRPDFVLGHSVGEIAAAAVAGVVSEEDAIRLAAARGRAIGALPSDGGMLALAAGPDRAGRLLAAVAPAATIAVVNGDEAVVIAGTTEDLAAVESAAAGIATARLPVSHAFHSPLVAPAASALRRALAGLAVSAPRLPFLSTVTAEAETRLDADYWAAQLSAPVRFADTVARALAEAPTILLEIGPRRVLAPLARRIVAARNPHGGRAPAVVASLGEAAGDAAGHRAALAALHAAGAPVRWDGVAHPDARPVDLPRYPFRRTRHWLDDAPVAAPVDAVGPSSGAGARLLGRRLPLPGGAEIRYAATHDPAAIAYFHQHRLDGRVVVPAASHLSAVVLALAEAGPPPWRLADLVFPAPYAFAEGERRDAQIVLARAAADGGGRSVRMVSTAAPAGDDAGWSTHLEGRIAPCADPPRAGTVPLPPVSNRHDRASFYAGFRKAGYVFGPSLTLLDEVAFEDGCAVARIAPAPTDLRSADHPVYPGVLDACFQTFGVWFETDALARDGALFVPYTIGSLEVFGRAAADEPLTAVAHRRRRADDEGLSVRGDLDVFAADGRLLVRARGFEFRRTAAAGLGRDAAPALEPIATRWLGGPVSVRPLAEDLAAPPAPRPPHPALAAVEALAAHHARAALAELGVATAADVDHLAATPHGRRLARHLLATLGPGTAAPEAGSLEAARADAARHADLAPALDLLDRTGPSIAEAIRGRVDPVRLLFPSGDPADLAALYGAASGFREGNAAAAAILPALAGEIRPRVLEIGAGTGATTAALLPALARTGCDWCFTDLSPRFLEAALARFGTRPGFTARRLDIESDLTAQGFEAGGYDLVVAANVLHATADLGATLARAAALVAPGGHLVLLEGTGRRTWVDVTFGLTEGWWRFADDRSGGPLVGAEAWRRLLARAGLEVEVLPVGDGLLYGQAVVVGRRPAVPDRLAAPLLVVGRPDGPANALAERLGARGVETRRVDPGPGVAAALSASRHAAVVHVADDPPATHGPSDDGPAVTTARAVARAAAAAATARAAADAATPLMIVTRAALRARDGEAPDPAAAALSGLAAAIAEERPETACRLVDLDAATDPAAAVLAELARPDPERLTAWRAGRRHVERLVPGRWAAPAPRLKPEAAYLVTGAFGGVGRAVATRLVALGARRLVLVGRRPPETFLAEDLVPARVETIALDVADPAAVAALVGRFGADLPPLAGVFHAAGILDDATLASVTAERLAAAFAPKLAGALALDAATRALDLDHFVLFASAIGRLGNAGQAAHAAANTSLDAVAAARRSAGLPGLALDWGLWGETGSAADPATVTALARIGLAPMTTAAALDAFGRALAEPAAGLVVAAFDAGTIARRAADRPFLTTLAAAGAPAASTGAAPAGRAGGTPTASDAAAATDGLPAIDHARLQALPAGERVRAIEAEIGAILAAILGGRPVERRLGLFKAGLDSLSAIDLRNRLQRRFGVTLGVTAVFDHPTLAELAEAVDALLAPPLPVPEPAPARPPPALAADPLALGDAEIEAMIDAEFAALREAAR